jgi:hypothetical protein
MEDREYREWAREVLLHWGEDVVYPTIPPCKRVEATQEIIFFLQGSIPWGYGAHGSEVGGTTAAILVQGLGIPATEALALVQIAYGSSPPIFRDFITGAKRPMVRVEED